MVQYGTSYLQLTQPFHHRLTLRHAAVLGLYFEGNGHDYAPWKCKQFERQFDSTVTGFWFYTYSFAEEMRQPLAEAANLMGATITEVLQEIIEDMCLPKAQMAKKRQHWLHQWDAVAEGVRRKVNDFLLPITKIEFPNIAAICARKRGLFWGEPQEAAASDISSPIPPAPPRPVGFQLPADYLTHPLPDPSKLLRRRSAS